MKRSRRTVRRRGLDGLQFVPRASACMGAILVFAVAAAQAQECAYVGNQLVGTVRILTIPDGDEVSNTVLPGCSAAAICQLTDIAVVTESTTVYVSQFDGNRLWALAAADPNNPAEPIAIPLPSAPTNMVLAPDHSRLFVVTFASNAMIVTLNTITNEGTGSFAAPAFPNGLAITPGGEILASTSLTQNTVFFFDAVSGETLEMGEVAPMPRAVAISPAGDRAYVASYVASEIGTLTVVDVDSGDSLDSFTVGMQPSAVAVAPNGGSVYVANRANNSVSVIDLASRQVSTIAVGASPVALAISSEGILLVANQQGESLSVIDTENGHTVLAPIPAGVSPSALAVAPCPPIAPATQTPTATATATATATHSATGTPTTGTACVGDCNGNGVVAINELILGVNISLGLRDVADCLAFDANENGNVEISELIRGVNNSLSGCPS